ncbi:T9SS type A sorting domain-containing protein [bacterium]|nr:T9SS type A sorting domain-containing protein [bacterium]
MIRWFTIGMLIILLTTVAISKPSPTLPVTHVAKKMNINADVQIPENVAGFTPRFSELDVLGDTVFVGTTYWDNQHNGTTGRMIGFTDQEVMINAQPHSDVAFISWTRLADPPAGNPRHVHYNRAWWTDGVAEIEIPNGSVVDGGARAGYTNLAFDVATGEGYPLYHSTENTLNPFHAMVSHEWDLFPGIFIEEQIPDYGENENIWPHGQFVEYDGEKWLHVVTSENRDDDNVAEMDILYSRSVWDEETSVWVPEEQRLITEHGMNINVDLSVSYDGSRVAIAQTVSRDWLNGEPEPTQHNNDMWLWISEDAGETWNTDDPIDLTMFIPPNDELLPDTAAANGDTMRVYADVNVYFDHDNILHVAFSVEGYDHYRGTITYTSQIYHWDEDSDVLTQAADGRFFNYCLPEVWGRYCDRPSMYQDPETGILWMAYRQLGVPGDTLDEGGIGNDVSDTGFGNYEVFLTASPPNTNHGDWYGRMWAKGINLTNTRGEGGALEAGECRSETDPSLSLYNPGPHLYLSYVLDLDAGFAAYSGDAAEGDFTDNPIVIHRVLKQEALDSFEEWLPNYPMHIDGTMHWEDPYDYEWGVDPETPETFGFFRGQRLTNVDDRGNLELLPGEFSLAQNYPNPFNPSTSIKFSLKRTGSVKLAVYDVTGREVATLVNRVVSSGNHHVNFHAEDLASGMYFYKLSSGDATLVQKMILMK